jgi:hypothetical protein
MIMLLESLYRYLQMKTTASWARVKAECCAGERVERHTAPALCDRAHTRAVP